MSIQNEPSPAALAEIPDLDSLSDRQRRALAGDLVTSPYTLGDGLFAEWDSGRVFDYGDPNARQVDAMLDTDGTARQLEQVLTLPLRSAEHTLTGGSERGRKMFDDMLGHAQRVQVIAQQTSAIAFRKAFFELPWSLDGRTVRLGQPAFRPATSCQSIHDAEGRPDGFRQRVHNPGGIGREQWARLYSGQMPGWIPVPRNRAHVYVHGTHRQPIKGVSDLSVAYWAYETRRKLLFLWLQYLELHSQPKVGVFGKDMAQAKANAASMGQLRAGGFVPVVRPDEPSARAWDVLEASGAGAGQFETAARYLEQHMTDSVLAGFTKLSTNAGSGAGSYALSADASAFFLASRQAVADEQAAQFTADLIAPACIYNGLDRDDVPRLRIGPLTRSHVDKSMELVGTLLTAQTVNAPDEFLDGLVTVVAPTLGLDADKLADAITAYREEQKRQREQMAAQTAAGGDAGGQPGTAPAGGDPGSGSRPAPGRSRVPSGRARAMGDEVDAAFKLMRGALAGQDPNEAAERMRGRNRSAA